MLQLIDKIGRGTGKVVGILYQAGRDTIDQVITNILPFMAFVSFIIGLILSTGVGTVIANTLVPLSSNLVGLLVLSFIVTLPFLSPLLGPGAVIGQIIGTLVGVEIGRGNVPVSMAMPAMFAVNGQCGCDFVPVGLAMSEAEEETIEYGVPAVLYSRTITGPIAVILAWVFSLGMSWQ